MNDGAHGNQISKSSLILGVENFMNDCSKSNVSIQYFPSYEIILDELRDYRFYAEDLVHPSDFAVKYIFEKFSDCYFNNDTLTKMKLAKK
jgi:GSCFA family.